MELFGRRRIVTDYTEITPKNVVSFLGKVLPVHEQNAEEMGYLFRYYRGDQPIRHRTKNIRPDIVDNTVVNRATEIVNFKVSYLLSEPVVFIGRHGSDGESQLVNRLNDYLYAADKAVHDKQIADDFSICGQAVRMIYPSEKGSEEPFEDWVMDPRKAFVVYANTAAKNSRKVAGVTIAETEDHIRTVHVYTDRLHMTVRYAGSALPAVKAEPNRIGAVPLVEYLNNQFRIGAFEMVLDLLDAENVLTSNRIEATEQAVQALTWFNDIVLDEASQKKLEEKQGSFIFTKTIPGAVQPSIEVVHTELQQADQQVLADDLYKNILRITGVPMTSDAETSDSSNNGSTIVRNGWQHAEARAKDTATLWEKSDKEVLRLVSSICGQMAGYSLDGLRPSDVEVKFTRRNYENIATKSTVLTQLLACDKVAPQIAYRVSDIVPDSEEACRQGLEYHEKCVEEQQKLTAAQNAKSPDQQTARDESTEDGHWVVRDGKRYWRRNHAE